MKILLLANRNSPHIEFWTSAIPSSHEVHIKSISSHERTSKKSYFRYLHRLLDSTGLSYFILGLKLRLSRSTASYDVMHSHNASGYGLTSLVSGHPYILTTYGSEIFKVDNANFIYNWLIYKVLDTASFITCSSLNMQKFLGSRFHIFENVFRISQPASESVEIDQQYYEKIKSQCNSIVLVANRRVEPQYRTLEMLEAFTRCIELNEKATLIVMQGATTSEYYTMVKGRFKHASNIIFIDGFLDKTRLYSLLKLADIAISSPLTDQLSSSIVEALLFSAVPALSTEPHYLEFEDKNVFWINGGNFETFFEDIASIDRTKLKCMQEDSKKLYENEYNLKTSHESVLRMYEKAVNQSSLT